MTVRLSPHKVSKILREYFSGTPQLKIAKVAAVDQSSISHYASRFTERAAEVGILAAGKEYHVLNEVEALRSLSVELYKSKLTVEEAKQGHNIIKAFLQLGISPEQHTVLIKVCKEVGDPVFIHAALKLNKIEQSNHLSYEEAVLGFEKITTQLPMVAKQLEVTQAELESFSSTLAEKKLELISLEEHVAQCQKEANVRKTKIEQELAVKMEQLNVKNDEVEKVATLKVDLAEQGLDIPTLIKLGKEFSHESSKD